MHCLMWCLTSLMCSWFCLMKWNSWGLNAELSCLNSLSPGRCGSNFKRIFSEGMSLIKFMNISVEIALRWMPLNTFDEKSTLVQVMAWCHQATIHYLSQCWPRSKPLPEPMLTPICVAIWGTRLQLVSARLQHLQCLSNGDTSVLC